MFVSRHNKYDRKYTLDDKERCQVLSEKVHSQQFYGFKSISMEGVELEIFFKELAIPMYQFNSYILDESDKMLALLKLDFALLFALFFQKGFID